MSASYNDWESDLSSIIEKTNSNLKLLRRIGDKRGGDSNAPPMVATAAAAAPRVVVPSSPGRGSLSSSGIRARYVNDDDNASVGSRASARSSGRPRVLSGSGGSVSGRGAGLSTSAMLAQRSSLSSSKGPQVLVRTSSSSSGAGGGQGLGLTAAMLAERNSAMPPAPVSMSLGEYSRLSESERHTLDEETRSHTGSHTGSHAGSSVSRTRPSVVGGGFVGSAAGSSVGLGAGQPAYNRPPSVVGVHTAARAASVIGVQTSRPAGMASGPQIRVPSADIPRNVPNYVIEDIKKSLETQFSSRTLGLEKKLHDLRMDVTDVTNSVAALQGGAAAGDASDLRQSVMEHADAIARLEQHSAQLLAHKVGVDQELAEVSGKLQALTSRVADQESALQLEVARAAKGRPAVDERLDKLDDKVAAATRQMGSLADMKAVEHLVGIRMAREVHELETRMAQSLQLATDKLESKLLQALDKQLGQAQRSDALVASIKQEVLDEAQTRFLSVGNGGLRKADLAPVQSAQSQLQEELAQLASAVARQERKAQDATQAVSAELRDELAHARQELHRAIQAQQGRVATALEELSSTKADQQLALLAKKQKRMEELTARMHDNMTAMRQELRSKSLRAAGASLPQGQRERLVAKSLAELEALVATKTDVERQYQQQVARHEERLAELRAALAAKETQMDAQRRELMETLQSEAKRMGVAEGKSAVLATLLAQEKADHEEKSELLRRTRKEMGVVRQKLRDVDREASTRRQQLASELQRKQQQVRELMQRLQLSERESSRLLEHAMREAKALRRLKATKEHELLLAKMQLGEMERAVEAADADEEVLQQAAEYVEQAEMRREEMEQMLLASHLEMDGLRQELEFVAKELDVAKEERESGGSADEAIAKVARAYEDKVDALQQQIRDKEAALEQLREAMAERSDLGAVESELVALKEDKQALLEAVQRAQEERQADADSSDGRLLHDKELAAMHERMEARMDELGEAQAALEASKERISALEAALEQQKAAHSETVERLTQEIKDARATIDGCSTEMLALKETKARLETELAQLEAKCGEDEAAADADAHADVEETQRVREELQATLDALAAKEELLQQAKASDEDNRQQLVAMAQAQSNVERRYLEELEALSQTLQQERESSQSREQDMSSTVALLSSEVALLRSESRETAALSDSLKASQTHEQRLQRRLQHIVDALSAVAGASPPAAGESVDAEDATAVDDDEDDAHVAAVRQSLESLQAQQQRTARELEGLQAEYERVVAKAASDSAAAAALASQADAYSLQLASLAQEVARLEAQLTDAYARRAAAAKSAGGLEDELEGLRAQTRALEAQVAARSAEYDACAASLQQQVDAKQSQVEALLAQNGALAAAMEGVRRKMDAVEADKARELDELREQLLALEARAEDLKRSAGGLQQRPGSPSASEPSVSALEREASAAQREMAALAMDARSAVEKLASSCGVLEWSDLRASVWGQEEATERLLLARARELARVQSAEQQVVLNADFLSAWADECAEGRPEEGEGGEEEEEEEDGARLCRPLWLSKYAALAPEVVRTLQAVEAALQEAAAEQGKKVAQALEASRAPSGGKHGDSDHGELLSESLSGVVEDYLGRAAAESGAGDQAGLEGEEEDADEMDEVERLMAEQAAFLDKAEGDALGGGKDEYLEESFDLEESLREDEDEHELEKSGP